MHCRSARHQQFGFTLVELLIGLAVIAVLMAVAVPNVLSQMPRYRLNGATRQVMGELMAARMKAINENGTVKVFFQDTQRYTICAVPNSASALNACRGSVTNKDIQDNYRHVTLTANNNPVFLSRGRATNMATITLANSSGSKNITISISGRVKIH
jgi:type IV fimbrial biogenesis protein FimT